MQEICNDRQQPTGSDCRTREPGGTSRRRRSDSATRSRVERRSREAGLRITAGYGRRITSNSRAARQGAGVLVRPRSRVQDIRRLRYPPGRARHMAVIMAAGRSPRRRADSRRSITVSSAIPIRISRTGRDGWLRPPGKMAPVARALKSKRAASSFPSFPRSLTAHLDKPQYRNRGAASLAARLPRRRR